MRRPLARLLILIPLGLTCSSCAPHMKSQVSLDPYSSIKPKMPPQSIPTTGSGAVFTSIQSKTAANPLKPTKQNLYNGRVFYGYYCAMCHGPKGDGAGPVGEAYVPKASDLTTGRLAGMSDGAIYKAMLTGPGHEPVMGETVAPDERWPIVLFVRTLAK